MSCRGTPKHLAGKPRCFGVPRHDKFSMFAVQSAVPPIREREKMTANNEQPSRRSVLKSAAAGAIAAASAPAIFTTMAKAAESKSKILGSGAHTYELVENWPKRPDDKPWGNTHMVQE